MVSRESTWSLLQYVTAALLAVFLTAHVLMHVPPVAESYHESLSLERVERNYARFGWGLLVLLFATLFHGLNGLRGIVSEVVSSRRAHAAADLLLASLFVVLAAYGVVTVMKWMG